MAELDNPDDDAEGMLVTLGGETGGYAMFVLEGRPTFVYNWLGVEQYTISGAETLPRGECRIVFDFAYDGGGAGKGGIGTLTVNGQTVGEGRIDKTVPVYFSTDDTFDIGEDWGTPMADTYEPPFALTGKIKKVTVQASRPERSSTTPLPARLGLPPGRSRQRHLVRDQDRPSTDASLSAACMTSTVPRMAVP